MVNGGVFAGHDAAIRPDRKEFEVRFPIPFCLLVSLTAPQLEAGSLEKAYFAATPPGSWARCESNWELPDGTVGTNVYTYIRASDATSRVRIETQTEVLSGPGSGTTTRQLFIMAPEFDLSENYLNRVQFLQATVAQSGDAPPALMQGNIIEILRAAAGDLTNSVTFMGHTEEGGRACDLYAYSYESGGPHVTLQEGEICLDEAVPFGIVFQKGRITKPGGDLVSSFEEKLLDSGSGKSGTAAMLALTPEEPAASPENAPTDAVDSLTLLEAYQNEKARLLVQVEDGTGGRRLELIAQNMTEDAFDLVLPGGPLTIPAGTPLGSLTVVVGEEQRFSLAPGGSSPAISAGQPGERGATGGDFQLMMYEGEPLFQGSVNVGPLE